MKQCGYQQLIGIWKTTGGVLLARPRIAARLQHCRGCRLLVGARCKVCGWRINTARQPLNFLAHHAAECPLSQWGPEEVLTEDLAPEFQQWPVKGNGMRYVKTCELMEQAAKLVGQLPADVSAVAGVPRSGMLPAAYLATLMHVPLLAATHGEFIPIPSGHRMTDQAGGSGPVLLVDDTCCSGQTIQHLRANTTRDFLAACIYCTPGQESSWDYVAARLEDPHLLEWNLFNSCFVPSIAWDLDGVFCDDINPADDDDGYRYVAAIESARPKQFPRRYDVQQIITARLERYRPQTEAWLKRYGIRCRQLVMGPWFNNAERAERGAISRFKADIYRQSDARLFVESDPRQAIEIAAAALKPVLCPDAGLVFGGPVK